MSSFNDAVRPNILLTGGSGYIGSHACVVLLEAGYDVTVVDSLVNSSEESLKRVCERIVKCDPHRIRYFNADIRDESALEVVFRTSPQFYAVIHFAGLKAVGESVAFPLKYYDYNVGGTIVLLGLMEKYNCRSIIFSSSATVYGFAKSPITEETPVGTGITNPYGKTKYMIEEIIRDFIASKNASANATERNYWSSMILRYFNPVGAHPSGHIGEDPNGPPNNLMPYVAQVAVGRRDKLTVFGNDYATPDGTGVRDYIHVMDLAEGHLAALQHLENVQKLDVFHGVSDVVNLGSGSGVSVLELIDAMRKASGKEIPYVIGDRRSGDIDVCFADPHKAKVLFGWSTKRDMNDVCADQWKWQSNNPTGYNSDK